MTAHPARARNGRNHPECEKRPPVPSGYNAAVKLRLPFEAELPRGRVRRAAVIAMLVLGGLVALLVPVVFAVVLFSILEGG
jgi:hypothetical protein